MVWVLGGWVFDFVGLGLGFSFDLFWVGECGMGCWRLGWCLVLKVCCFLGFWLFMICLCLMVVVSVFVVGCLFRGLLVYVVLLFVGVWLFWCVCWNDACLLVVVCVW